jgi:sortase (surface protein transpeptidase)
MFKFPKIISFVVAFLFLILPVVAVEHQTIQTNISKDITSEVIKFVPASANEETVFKSRYNLRIDAININTTLETTRLNLERSLMVPKDASIAAWYDQGPKPGNAGTALITGHLESRLGPGIFYNLKNLVIGDEIVIRRENDEAVFHVDKLESYFQDHRFPWTEVYSTNGYSQLRIITCDGEYNSLTDKYSKNLVVFATLLRLQGIDKNYN